MERDEARTKAEKVAKELEEAKKQLAALQKRPLIHTFRQPVLLVGPREVGKTSLMHHWHVPWDSADIASTGHHQTCEVPVYDHHADVSANSNGTAESQAPTTYHLVLKVHDFPGELRAQQLVTKLIREETSRLRTKSKSNLGAVIICMFDAEEAHLGVRPQTHEYYNGDLFRTLRMMVAQRAVDIERVVLVFNKLDLLRKQCPDAKDGELNCANPGSYGAGGAGRRSGGYAVAVSDGACHLGSDSPPPAGINEQERRKTKWR